MEYSEDDIKNTKRILESYLSKYGIERTVNLLRVIGNEQFWLEYDGFKEDKLEDEEDEQEQEQDEELEDFFEEELENTQIDGIEITQDDVKKLWKVFTKDSEVQSIISNSMQEMEYDPNEIATRATTVYSLISTIELLDQAPEEAQDDFNVIYKAVNNKLEQINNDDFYLVYVNVIAENFFKNSKFEDTIRNKLDNMSTSEFMYFMLTAQSYIDINYTPTVEIIKHKVEKLDDPFVNKVYEALQYYDAPEDARLPQAKISFDKLSNEEKLIRGIDDPKVAVETFSNFTDTEFMKYVLSYESTFDLFDSNIRNSKIFEERIKKLSRENIIFLVEKFTDIYQYAKEVEESEETIPIKEYAKQFEILFDEAKRRKLITDDFEVTYSDEDMFKVIQKEKVYDVNRNIGILPYFNPVLADEEVEEVEYYETGDKREYEYEEEYYDEYGNEYDDIYDNEDIDELENFETMYPKIKSYLKFYNSILELNRTPDINVLQMANHYNLKCKEDDVSQLSDFQQYVVRYLQSRILNMPIKYSTFFMCVDNGCLGDAMEIKADELQNKILNNQLYNSQEK
ncbi:MAG: hypothetical protein J6I85_04350 [Clostridia bacterium]|nr:hypothetical protein [Clostridia bacterium]